LFIKIGDSGKLPGGKLPGGKLAWANINLS
jgi:hypothetical protein